MDLARAKSEASFRLYTYNKINKIWTDNYGALMNL